MEHKNSKARNTKDTDNRGGRYGIEILYEHRLAGNGDFAHIQEESLFIQEPKKQVQTRWLFKKKV